MSDQKPTEHKIIPFPAPDWRVGLSTVILLGAVVVLAIYGTVCCFKADKLYREAKTAQTAAQTLRDETALFDSESELIAYTSQLQYHPIQWHSPNGQNIIFCCTQVTINGPFAPDAEQKWFRKTLNGDYTNHRIGSYDEVGEQWFYNYYRADGGKDRLDGYQLIKIGEYAYELKATFGAVEPGSYRDLEFYEEDYAKFNVNFGCIKGRNDYNRDTYVQLDYDDEHVVGHPDLSTVSPCGCVNCCCDVCNCNK